MFAPSESWTLPTSISIVSASFPQFCHTCHHFDCCHCCWNVIITLPSSFLTIFSHLSWLLPRKLIVLYITNQSNLSTPLLLRWLITKCQEQLVVSLFLVLSVYFWVPRGFRFFYNIQGMIVHISFPTLSVLLGWQDDYIIVPQRLHSKVAFVQMQNAILKNFRLSKTRSLTNK